MEGRAGQMVCVGSFMMNFKNRSSEILEHVFDIRWEQKVDELELQEIRSSEKVELEC